MVGVTRIILLFALLILFSISAYSETYYMANESCSDSWDGNSTNPWCTFEHAYTIMSGGDTLNLFDGKYLQELHPPSNLSGSPGNYTTFSAVNYGSVIIAPTTVGNDEAEGSIYVYSSITWGQTSYVHFDGLFAKGVGEHAAISITSMDFATKEQMTHHINITRCGAMGAAVDYNVVAFGIGIVKDVFVEDSFAFGFGRKAMQIYGAIRITVRRMVVRYDWWEGDSYKPSDPRVSLSTYNTINATLENIIAIDAGPHPASTAPDRASLVASGNKAGGTAIEGSENVYYLGCIIYNNDDYTENSNGFEINGGTGEPARNLVFKDIIIQSSCNGFNIHDNVVDLVLDRITSTNNTHIGIRVNPYPTYNISNITIKNAVSTDNDVYGIFWDESMATVTNSTTTRNVMDNTDLEPQYEPSIEYLPTNTPVSGHARGGIVENRYVGGSLTSESLWPWPYEDVIKNYMCNPIYLEEIEDKINDHEGTSINYTPGFCNFSGTLTEYLWGALGNSCPTRICNYTIQDTFNDADLNTDNIINTTEVRYYISEWIRGSATIGDLTSVIDIWKKGGNY